MHDETGRMERLTAQLPTKAAKIRVLSAAGYKRQEIANFLNIRYQHVRNVLVQPGPRRSSGATETVPPVPEVPSGVAESAPSVPAYTAEGAPDAPPDLWCGRFSVDSAGRVSLPPELLAAIGYRPGLPIPWRFEDGEVRIMGPAAGLRFAQSVIDDFTKRNPGADVGVGALSAARREDAARESAGGRNG